WRAERVALFPLQTFPADDARAAAFQYVIDAAGGVPDGAGVLARANQLRVGIDRRQGRAAGERVDVVEHDALFRAGVASAVHQVEGLTHIRIAIVEDRRVVACETIVVWPESLVVAALRVVELFDNGLDVVAIA